MFEKFSARQLWLSIALFGISLEAAIIAWMIYNPTATRLCKPVVPMIVVDLGEGRKTKDGRQLLMQYSENAIDPTIQKRPKNPLRIASCDIKNRGCIAPRARFEMRSEGPRLQSIEVYLIDGIKHPFASKVQWKGAAFPDSVAIRCDLDNEGQPKACKLIKIGYLAELSNRRQDRDEARLRRHDKCQPTLSRLLHGTASD